MRFSVMPGDGGTLDIPAATAETLQFLTHKSWRSVFLEMREADISGQIKDRSTSTNRLLEAAEAATDVSFGPVSYSNHPAHETGAIDALNKHALPITSIH